MLSRRELVLATAGLVVTGCKGAQQIDVAITKPVEIRPVADADLWVRALGGALQSEAIEGVVIEVERRADRADGEQWDFRAKTPRQLRSAIDQVLAGEHGPGPQPEHLALVFEALIERESGALHTAYFIEKTGGFVLEDGARAAMLEDGPMPVILLKMTEPDGARFAELSASHVGKRLAMIVDGVCLSAPIVYEPIKGGEVQLTSGPPSTKKAIRQQFEALTT